MEKVDFEEMVSVQDAHWWFKGKRRIIDKLLKKERKNIPLNILEIGSGTGANLPVLCSYGSVTALEIDDYARDFIARSAADRQANVTVAKGSLPDGLDAVLGETFDLICLFDVLEHIEHDGESLVVLKKHLRPDGRLLLTVPAYQWMYSNHDKVLGHYRRYTQHGLRKLCAEHGFEILYSSYMNTFLFPLMLVARLVDRICGVRLRSASIEIPPWGINSLFNVIFLLESLCIPSVSFPFGGSVLLIAKCSYNI